MFVIYKFVIRFVSLLIPVRNIRRRFKSFMLYVYDLPYIITNKRRFLRADVKPKSVLLIEPNDWHGEIMPGYVKYFQDLGYNVDLLMRHRFSQGNPFVNYPKDKMPRIFYIDKKMGKDILSLNKVSTYDFLFMNSSVVKMDKTPISYINAFLQFLPQPKVAVFLVEHNCAQKVEMGHDKYDGKVFSLLGANDTYMLNPHYFGDIKFRKKSVDKVMFYAVINHKDNETLLFDSVRKLLNMGYDNFRVTIGGRTATKKVPKDLKKVIKITGFMPFDKMWEILEETDFFMFMLNPENKSQEKYKRDVVSGSLQTVLGFEKPSLIHSDFAENFLLDKNSALVYESNAKLSDAMLSAIKMSDSDYSDMRENVKRTANKIYSDSLENLRLAIEKNLKSKSS